MILLKKWICALLCLALTAAVLSGCGQDAFQQADLISITGTPGANAREEAENLLDHDETTKWCVTDFHGAYAIWSYSCPVTPTGYTITTGNDNSRYPGRNPAAWTLYGSTGSAAPRPGSGNWQVIHSVSGDTRLQDVDQTPFHYDIGSLSQSYTHFMLEVTQTAGATVMQLADFILTGNGLPTAAPTTPAATAPSDSAGGNAAGITPMSGSVTITDGGEYAVLEGDSLILYYARMPISAYYAYTWTAESGGECITMDPDGPTCEITGVKTGTVTLKARLDYTVLTSFSSDHYSHEYTITVYVVPDNGQGANRHDVSKGSCPRCFGNKIVDCTACFGDGQLDGGKPCSCGTGKMTCPTCDGSGKWSN